MHTSLFQTNKGFRWSVMFTITCIVTLVTLIVYGILLIRPDRIAEKRDVAAARAALEARLKAEDNKGERQHKELMDRFKVIKSQQEKNVKEIRKLKERLGE